MTSKQREAFLLAVRAGYYNIPRKTIFATLAEELGN
ncbi:MAG: helix-turn-helix domain-containing protein [Candidatus Thorarchaeota archaeon]